MIEEQFLELCLTEIRIFIQWKCENDTKSSQKCYRIMQNAKSSLGTFVGEIQSF